MKRIALIAAGIVFLMACNKVPGFRDGGNGHLYVGKSTCPPTDPPPASLMPTVDDMAGAPVCPAK
jgi:hypothetical protein